MNQRSSATSLYLILILLIGLIARLIALNQSFWLDEAAQAIISQNPFEPGHFNGDFQPPLSYILSHVWIQLGNALGTQAEWFLRLPSVMWGVAAIWAIHSLIKTLFTEKAAHITALLLALAPFHIYYSQEFRMYSMFTALTMFSWLALQKKQYGWMALINGLSVFTHYFAFVTIFSQGIYLIVSDPSMLKKVVQKHIISLAPFIFWLPTLHEQLKTSSALIAAWPKWESLSNAGFFKFPGLTLAKFTVGMISPEPRTFYIAAVASFALILGTSLMYLAKKAFQEKSFRNPMIMLLAMSIVPLTLVWIAGIWVSAASPWRIQFALPALYALIAVAVTSTKKFRSLALSALIFLLLQNTFFSYQYLSNTKNHREDWRSAVAYTDSLAAQKNALILSEYIHPFAPMQWYSQSPEAYSGGSSHMTLSPSTVTEKIAPLLPLHNTIVVYSYLFEISDPQKTLDRTLVSSGYTLSTEKDFRGVGIVRTYSRAKKD